MDKLKQADVPTEGSRGTQGVGIELPDHITEEHRRQLEERYRNLEPVDAYIAPMNETVMPDLPPGAALDVEVDVPALLRYYPEDCDPEALSRHVDEAFRQIRAAVAGLKPGDVFVHADCIRIVGAFTPCDQVNVVPKALPPGEAKR